MIRAILFSVLIITALTNYTYATDLFNQKIDKVYVGSSETTSYLSVSFLSNGIWYHYIGNNDALRIEIAKSFHAQLLFAKNMDLTVTIRYGEGNATDRYFWGIIVE